MTIFSLEEEAARAIRLRPTVSVYVRADRELEYGKVVEVMTVLKKAGAKKIGLIDEALG